MIDKSINLLKDILDKSYHIAAGIKAEDDEIALRAIEDREELINRYIALGTIEMTDEIRQLLSEIHRLDEENMENLLHFMEKVKCLTSGVKKELTQLKKGKSIVNSYENAGYISNERNFDIRK